MEKPKKRFVIASLGVF